MTRREQLTKLMEKNNGSVSYGRMYRLDLHDLARIMVSKGELLLGRDMTDGSYHFGHLSQKEEVFSNLRWLKEPLITSEQCMKGLRERNKK